MRSLVGGANHRAPRTVRREMLDGRKRKWHTRGRLLPRRRARLVVAVARARETRAHPEPAASRQKDHACARDALGVVRVEAARNLVRARRVVALLVIITQIVPLVPVQREPVGRAEVEAPRDVRDARRDDVWVAAARVEDVVLLPVRVDPRPVFLRGGRKRESGRRQAPEKLRRKSQEIDHTRAEDVNAPGARRPFESVRSTCAARALFAARVRSIPLPRARLLARFAPPHVMLRSHGGWSVRALSGPWRVQSAPARAHAR